MPNPRTTPATQPARDTTTTFATHFGSSGQLERTRDYRLDPDIPGMVISFMVRDEDAPALRAAIEEIRNEVGGRLEAPHAFATEQALTDAARALGALHAVLVAKIPQADPFYLSRARERAA